MSLNVTYHGLDMSYSCDLCEVEQPQKRFKAFRRRSANFYRARSKQPIVHRNSDLLNCTLSLSQSLAVGEGDGSGIGHKLVGANSVNSIITSAHAAQEEESGRVAGWAVGFSRLLADPAGLAIFTEFLKKEFSQENIEFWSAVEAYKQITDENSVLLIVISQPAEAQPMQDDPIWVFLLNYWGVRRAKAQEMYKRYVGSQASDPVNVDSMAKQLTEQYMDSPTPNMFDVAQQQIFQLMRTDSYSRFLKSDLYKGHLMREMEGQTLSLPSTVCTNAPQPDVKKKGKGKENDEKRRKSLLPWRQNKKSSVKESKGKGKDKEERKDKEVNNNMKKAPGPGIDLSTMRKEVFQPAETEQAESGEPVRFCRVVMPDKSTTVVCTRPGVNIRNVLGKLCDKRNLSIASVDVFLLGSDKPLDLEEDISALGSKEVVIERRVLFRLDLPNHKSIGVKAKPNRSIRDVFKPILNKYGHRIDSCGVQLSGLSEFLDLDIPVSDLDNQRVIVTANPENADGNAGPATQQVPLSARHRRTPLLHLPSRSRGAGGKGGSLEEITNQIFDDLMKGKSELAHTFDELGVVDLERGGKGHKNSEEHRSLGLFGLLRKESWGAKDTTKQKSKGRVTFALPRSDSKKKKAAKAEEERLMEEIARVHSQQLKEDKETPVDNHPDFLATDLVETVDMAIHMEAKPRFSSSEELVVREDMEKALLPPPDMFDDVHYMHSGPSDDTHLADRDENEQVVDSVAAPFPHIHSNFTPRLTTFGTPRSKGEFFDNDPKGVASKLKEESNPYLSMQPVIVDSRDSAKEDRSSRLSVDLKTLGKTVSPHFDSVQSFRPARGPPAASSKAPVTSQEKLSPEKCQTPDVEKMSATDTSKDQLRPIPARRRLLDNTTANRRSASPRTTKQNGMNSAISEVSSPRQSRINSTQPDLISPRTSEVIGGSRASPSRHSPKSGATSERNSSSLTSTPSPTIPTSASLTPGIQQDATPRYTPPPSYSSAVGNRQTSAGSTKFSTTPPYSAGTPSTSARTSPLVGSTLQRQSPGIGTPASRSSHSAEQHSQESVHLYSTKETPRNGAGFMNAQDRHSSSQGAREAQTPRDQKSILYLSHEAPRNNSSYGVNRTPRDGMVVTSVGREPPTPRDHSHLYGTRQTHRNLSSGEIKTPRDNVYDVRQETPRESTQLQQNLHRTSGSWDSVGKTHNSIVSPTSPRSWTRDHMMKSPRNGPLNGYIDHPSYNNAPAKSFHKNSSPGESEGHRSQSVDTLSPRQTRIPESQDSNSSSVVAAEVHQPPDHHHHLADNQGFPRSMSTTLDASAFSEQTVTFV